MKMKMKKTDQQKTNNQPNIKPDIQLDKFNN